MLTSDILTKWLQECYGIYLVGFLYINCFGDSIMTLLLWHCHEMNGKVNVQGCTYGGVKIQ